VGRGTDTTRDGRLAVLRAAPRRPARENALAIQRARVIAAAIEAVEDVGRQGLTVADIAARARVARKTFYDVFDDLEDCFCGAFEYVIDQARAPLREAFQRESDWQAGMRGALRELLALAEEQPGLARLCLLEALAPAGRVAVVRSRVVHEIAEVIDRARDVGDAEGRVPEGLVVAEAIVGGIFTVIHLRLLSSEEAELADLLDPCMYLLVAPYLGTERAANEHTSRPRTVRVRPPRLVADRERPLEGLEIRLTYRTVRVLGALSEYPGACNREVAAAAGVLDPGQISKLLHRLEGLELVENRLGAKSTARTGNAWHLTPRGAQVLRTTFPPNRVPA